MFGMRVLAIAAMLSATMAVADATAPEPSKAEPAAASFDGNVRATEAAADSDGPLSSIPEPGTLGLIAAGLAVMVFVARRQPRD